MGACECKAAACEGKRAADEPPCEVSETVSAIPTIGLPSGSSPPPMPIVLISDPGQDLDDEMAYIMCRYLVHESMIALKGIITTLCPAFDRARLCRGTLDTLGLYDVPVGNGTDGGDQTGTHKASTFEDWAKGYMTSEGSERVTHIAPGRLLLTRIYAEAKPKSLTLVIIAALKDPALFLRDNEDLFAEKTRQVVIMGGVEPWETDEPACMLTPDTAHNQVFDKQSSSFFYRRCQELGVQLVVVSRWAAYAAKVPRAIYDDLAGMGSTIGCRLRNAQRSSIEALWVRASSSADDPRRAGLPTRCDREWFLKTFCGGAEAGKKRGPADTIWDLVVGFMQYDTIAILAAIPSLRESLFRPIAVKGLKNTEHLVIGKSEAVHGVSDPDGLSELLSRGFHRGLALNHRGMPQFILLAQPLWNNVSEEMLAITLLRALYSVGIVGCVGLNVTPGPADPDNQEQMASTDMEFGKEDLLKIKTILQAVGLSHIPAFVSRYKSDESVENIRQLYERVGPAGVSLVVTGCLGNVLNFAKAHPDTFRTKTQVVVHVGGATFDLPFYAGYSKTNQKRYSHLSVNGDEEHETFLYPDPLAQSNKLDIESAVEFYEMIQKTSLVPMRILSRECVRSFVVPSPFFDALNKTGGTVGRLIYDTRKAAMETLWKAVRSSVKEERYGLPRHCDRDWFVQVLCDGGPPANDHQVLAALGPFFVYTALSILSVLPQVSERGFDMRTITVRSVNHGIIGGLEQSNSGIKDPQFLRTLLYQCIFKGCFLNVSDFDLTEVPSMKIDGSDQYWFYDRSELALKSCLKGDFLGEAMAYNKQRNSRSA